MITDALRRRAAELGVQLTYEDVDGVDHDADPVVVERVVEMLADDRARLGRDPIVAPVHLDPSTPVRVDGPIGDAELLVDDALVDVTVVGGGVSLPGGLPHGCHTLRVDAPGTTAECLVVVAPATMPDLGEDVRASSLFTPAYGLWEDEAPLPSLRHLHTLARHLGERGIDTLATLPLYATFLDEPFDPSPYSPISRLHWNEAYLDDAGLPEAPLPTFTSEPGGVVDWRAVAERRRRQLVQAASEAGDDLVAALTQFAAAHPDVGSYARFRAQRESSGDLVVERSHVLAQYLADRALAAIGDDEDAAGLSLDLPIGSHPDGWETWAYPNLFASSMAVGAPPDTFFTEGQNWGFPPQLPTAMRASGYDLWRQMLRRTGRHATMLRIDHVMAVHRLWWVPDGQEATRGVYVTYPRDELLAVIAAEAAAAGVSVVGENLGTVPPEVSTALEDWKMLGMYEEQFMMGDAELASIPSRSVAGVRTHDMAAFAQAVDDLDAHDADETDDATDADDEIDTHDDTHDDDGDEARGTASYRSLLGDPDGPLLDAVLLRLASSDAQMVVADLDDLLDETRPHNLPGRVVEGIWQRRLDRSLTDTLADDTVDRRLGLLERTTP